MKKILGLDLGTNSIGWAVVNADEQIREDGSKYLKPTGISNAGSRIIPMSADILGDFDKGNSISQTAERSRLRMARRLHERALLRRERLLRVLNLMGFLPKHFANKINRYGKFTDDSEPKIAWRKNADGKMEFVFQDSFHEMLEDFKKHQPELVNEQKKVPYDWTIYYLRQKALKEPLTKEELAWVLLQFNQKRGYNQLRGEEEEEKSNETIEIIAAKILSVERKEKDKKYDKYWYEMPLDNGLTYRAAFYNDVSSWKNETKEFVLKTTILKDGTKKEELSFLPTPDEIEQMDAQRKGKMYAKIKLRTETNITNSKKTIGCYIYESLLNNPNQKIIGKLVRTVERKFYKDELQKILKKQQSLIPELHNEVLYQACIEELYANNEAHRKNISKPDFVNFFLNDILFYQRPLKSKKSLISNCPYEEYLYKENGETKKHPIKCIAKSNPYFQEFRLWQFIQNLRIYQREVEIDGKLYTDKDVTSEWLKNDDNYVQLFDWLNDRPSIKQDVLLNSYFKIKKEKGKDQYPYRWNYVEDKEYPCNETRAAILAGLKKCGTNENFLTPDTEMSLWHLLYSIDDKKEIEQALNTFASKHSLNENFVEVFKKIKPFAKDYGSYSEKAIKKLLPLMRMGKYWKEENIDENTKNRIDKIINAEYDENIRNRVRDASIDLKDISQFRGLPIWLACYIVYDRHSEAKEIEKWNSPEDINSYLKNFKQHSLRNPIVEQVVTETLRTVRDIWKQEGSIDEIHLELGRELKNPADVRKKMTERIQQNENTNLRIKALLMEFANPEMGIENIRPHSPKQQDILKIYEDYALSSREKYDQVKEEFVPDTDIPDYVSKVVSGLNSLDSKKQPTKSEIQKYKCWLEQRYRSPYTGKMIPLAKLFTNAYEIEHIIPQSRYFDDSFSNKVICESEVNKLKDNQLGFEFIKNHHGEKVQLSQGDVVEIFSIENYEKFVKDNYSYDNAKKKKLLMDDIPDDFIERQLNDSRYISKVVKGLLSNIVREKDSNDEYEQEAVSKNLIPCNGSITDRLKKDWGMNDVWNSIILPRFQRLNQITGKNCFTTTNTEGHDIPAMPLELQKGFNKKRIDHRHHAMDAIVIACTTRSHIQYLNNENAKTSNRKLQYALAKQLCSFKDIEYFKKEKTNNIWVTGKEKIQRKVPDRILKPWDSFTTDAKTSLENIIVSFKQNQRIINKTANHIQHINNQGKKILVEQEKSDSWAIRKSMHKATIFGEIKNLRLKKDVKLSIAVKNINNIADLPIKQKIKDLLIQGYDVKSIESYFAENKKDWPNFNSSKIPLYYLSKDTKDRYFATRFGKDLVSIFKNISDTQKAKDTIEKITDSGIQKILLAHLVAKNNNPEQAFSPDGIDEMNRNIVALNKRRFHQPIFKVRVFEKSEKKFAIGQAGNKSAKFAEADDGTNLFFAIFCNEQGVRSYLTIPLNVMIDCQKQFGAKWKDNIEQYIKDQKLISGDVKLSFILSPNDLVYLPTEDELKNGIKSIDKKRIYKIVSFTGNRLYAILFNTAKSIVDKVEYTQLNKIEFTDSKQSIKEICIPLKVDRLGNVIEINGHKIE